MSAARYVLDTSALLTLIEDEAGADRIEKLLKQAEAVIPAVALLEVHYISLQEQDSTEADLRYALLKRSGAEILWELEEPIVLTAADLKARFKLSLADAIIAACALRLGAVLVHKDPEFEALAEMVAMESLPYKTPSRRP